MNLKNSIKKRYSKLQILLIGYDRNSIKESYKKDVEFCATSNVKTFNFWPELKNPEDLWFYKFINHRLQGRYSTVKPITFFSVFGKRDKMRMNKNRPRVFYSGENVDLFSEYSDHCIKDVDLSLGFDYLQIKNHMRFPLWLTWFFDPTSDSKAIEARVNKMANFTYDFNVERKFCTLISRHDNNGIRAEISDAINDIEPVAFAGAWRNNTTSLYEEFRDDKASFLRNYKFNICPENSNKSGYVTEKVFEAIEAGCIPVYWGSDNNPEPEVLNKDAILFYDGDKEALKRKVSELHSDKMLYREFVSQKKLLPCTAEYVSDMFSDLETRLSQLRLTGI